MQTTPVFCTVYSSAIVVVKRKKKWNNLLLLSSLWKFLFQVNFRLHNLASYGKVIKATKCSMESAVIITFWLQTFGNVKDVDLKSIPEICRALKEEMMSYKTSIGNWWMQDDLMSV